MIIFETLDELKNFLRRDQGQKSFSPVRFINVESQAAWRELKNFLSTLTTDLIFLSDYCAGEDTFPNVRKLRNNLRRENQSVCILPLSEILRLNPERAAEEINFFLSLHTGEPFAFRIYFPMYRLKNFFLSLKISDPRRKNCVLLSTEEAAEDFSLTIIQKNMPLKISGTRADGLKQYLKFWEESLSASLILYTENAVYLQDKKFFDDVKIIANAFDLLRHQHDLPAEFKKNFGREEDWQRLAESVATAGNFEQAFRREFKVDGFKMSAFKNFGTAENFRRWLLWLRCKLQGSDYAARCAKESSTPEEFVEQLYGKIFSCAEEKFFEERREILSLMKTLPPKKFLERTRQAEKKIALKILTDNSHAERLMIFETLQRFRFGESSAARKILQRTFPQLANYLSDGAEGFTEEQAEYFRQYRWLKVTNQLTEKFNRRVAENARHAGEKIYALRSRNEIVGEEYSGAAAIFFVDGLGAEYMNFFAAEFSSLEENFSVRYRIGRCNLPTVTELNKDFLQNRKVAAEILELDTLKHEIRAYPENILGELEILSTFKEKILHALDVHEKIILCSDHGTSRLAVLARQNFDKAFPAEGRKVFKSGRFAEILPNDEKNFPTTLAHDEKLIFADYSRFTQKGGTGSEIHGGASLEEVLVPVITIERRKKFSPQKNFSSASTKIKRGISDNKNFDI